MNGLQGSGERIPGWMKAWLRFGVCSRPTLSDSTDGAARRGVLEVLQLVSDLFECLTR